LSSPIAAAAFYLSKDERLIIPEIALKTSSTDEGG